MVMAKISAATTEEVRSEFNFLDFQNEVIIVDHRTSFDEECRKIQYEAELGRSGTGSASERSLRGLIREDTHILHTTNHSQLIDHLIESHKAARMASLRAHESSLSQLNSSTSSFHKCPPNEVASAASVGARFEPKPFSSALEVLSLDKGMLVVDFLSEPYCLPQDCIKNVQSCHRSNTIVTLKAEPQSRQNSRRFACHCSSGQPNEDGTRMNGSHTSLSLREIKRRLKHTFGSSRRKESDPLPRFRHPHSRLIFGHGCIYSGVGTRNPLSSNTNVKPKEKVGKKQGLIKVEREPLGAGDAEAERKKIDVSGDIALEAASSLQHPWRVMSSIGMDSCFIPRRESQYISGSAQVSLRSSPSRQSVYLSPLRPYDGTMSNVRAETSSSLVATTDEEALEARISTSPNIMFNGTDDVHQTETPQDTMISSAERAAKIKLQRDEYDSLMHSLMDSISENETFSNTVDDFPSSPTLDLTDNNKYQEEYESPVSVLDQFFAEESSSPSSNTTFQSARGLLKPRRLHFEELNSASSSHDTPTGSDPCKHDRDYTISNYARLILEASSLSWDQLSAMRLPSEHLLHPSLFDQAQFLEFDHHFDTKLLFDHVNEVLLETQRALFLSPYWPAFPKPRMCCLPLEEAVVDEIMREAEFYLLPRTQRRTLDQLIAKDLSGPRSQPDLRPEMEQIILHMSEYILEESVLHVVLELHS